MGNLLGAPVTDKDTHKGESSDGLKWGVTSMQGWRVHMEDAHVAETRLYAAEPIHNTSANKDASGNNDMNTEEANDDDNNKNSGSEENPPAQYRHIELPGHSIFAVFDGHGGTFAAQYAGRNLCRVLSRQPKFVQYAKFMEERTEKEKLLTKSRERVQYITTGLEYIEGALSDAFVELDKEIASALQGSKIPEADTPYHKEKTQDSGNNATGEKMDCSENNESEADSTLRLLEKEGDSGTTACVVIVAPQWVVCANAGDSRAVFSKHGNKAVPLSYDHKPDDEEEERRIRAAGGYVAGGRVEGDLAVSRGLGDFRFKNMSTVLAGADGSQNNPNRQSEQGIGMPGDQKVSPVPDVIIQNRSADKDEFILLACDGIWDVQTNYEAVKAVADIFEEGESDMGLLCEEICDSCLSMGSKDNMTAVIVKFEGQKIGQGGGVVARRKLRDSAKTNNNSSAEDDEPVDQS